VQQRGDRLVVNVALTDVRDGSEIWGDEYDRKLDDILALQDKIAKNITAHLRLRLTGEEERRLAKRDTENSEAYQLYAKGRFFWDKRTPEGISKAISHFKQATEIDPTYALAYAGLADCYVVPANRLPPKEKMPKAKAAALKALDLDDTLAEAHTTLARVLTVYDWNWSGAKQEFQRAIELNPRYAVAHQWYGGYWEAIGQHDESIAERKRALQLEPLSLIVSAELALAYYSAGQYGQAIKQVKKALEMDPSFPPAQSFLAAAYEQKGMYPEAITGFKNAIAVNKGGGWASPLAMAGLGHVYAVSGNKSEAWKLLDELKQMSEKEYTPAPDIALIYAGLGEKDQALEWLEKAYEERSFNMTFLKVEPRWESLRSDPRFADLLRRMGLADKASERDQGIHSVAVLPFKNEGGDPKTEYLSNGLADQIHDSLRQVRRRDLTIRSLPSVSRYKGRDIDVKTVARELDVQVLVTGTLRQLDDELTIRVDLVDGVNDNSIWSHSYPGKLAEILNLQDKIAREVAAHLRLGLTGEEETRLTKRSTTDTEAYLHYREAMYHFNKFSPEGLTAAIKCCEQAIQKDPTYALAHAALARCLIVRGSIFEGPKKTFPKALEHVNQALDSDPDLPEAHAALGTIYLLIDWNWAEAEHELNRALDLDPNVILTRNILGFCLVAQGRLEEALASIQRGQELDPLAAARWNEVAMCYNTMGRYDEAIEAAKLAIKLDEHFVLAYGEWGTALSQTKHHDEAIEVLNLAVKYGKGHPRMRGLLGCAYAQAGKEAEARREVTTLLSERRFGSALALARIYATLGEKAQAFEWLHKAGEERDSIVFWLKSDPNLANLRSDPQFTEMVKDMGLPR
jgi:tetratricopeptide (TPR) repeat protein